jgi:plasmid stabilization system protein ParE
LILYARSRRRCDVSFSEHPPSERWTALTFNGSRLAEVWFKPEEEPLALVFRIPRSTFENPDVIRRLTPERLLKSVGVAADDVGSWNFGSGFLPTRQNPEPVLTGPLPQPPSDAAHLEIRVRLKPPTRTDAHKETAEPAAANPEWDDLVAVWKAILVIESSVEATRKSVEGVRAEVESAARRSLTGDEKVYAVSSDVANWTRAKNRAHFVLPKANDFIHRATWAASAAERKKIAEVFENPAGAPGALPPTDQLLRDLESLRKSRQVLSAQGTAVYQECRAIVSEVQGALRQLQSNAATRASQKKGATGRRGKSF